MSKERKFEEDQVYLKTPDGQIWPYDTILAKARGVEKVIPNPSKAKEAEQESEQEPETDK